MNGLVADLKAVRRQIEHSSTGSVRPSLARAGRIATDELAIVYAALGESRRASELLERACQEHAPALAYAAVEPVMEFLRTDPECRPVLERAGLIASTR